MVSNTCSSPCFIYHSAGRHAQITMLWYCWKTQTCRSQQTLAGRLHSLCTASLNHPSFCVMFSLMKVIMQLFIKYHLFIRMIHCNFWSL
jgi:hypothetical protein